MNKAQIIATYKSARNVKIALENELVKVCDATDLIAMSERNLAVRRYRMDNPTLTESETKNIIYTQFANHHAGKQYEETNAVS